MSAEVKESGSHLTATNFAGRAHIALNDKPLRANFRRAMDGLMAKRAAQFPDAGDLAQLRAKGRRHQGAGARPAAGTVGATRSPLR